MRSNRTDTSGPLTYGDILLPLLVRIGAGKLVAKAVKVGKHRYRSAVTGKFVKADYARQNPETTVRERV